MSAGLIAWFVSVVIAQIVALPMAQPAPTLIAQDSVVRRAYRNVFVHRVIDGDTFEAAIDLTLDFDVIFVKSIRVAGLDCEELRPRGKAGETAEQLEARRRLARRQRDIALGILPRGRQVTLRPTDKRSFHRLVMDVEVLGRDYRTRMIQEAGCEAG